VTRKKACVDRFIEKEVTRLAHSLKTELSKKLILPGMLDELVKKVSATTIQKTRGDYWDWKKSIYLGELKNEEIWLLSQVENNFWHALFKSLRSLSRRHYKKMGLYPVFIFLFEYLNNHPRKGLILYLKYSVMGAKRYAEEPIINEGLFIHHFGLPKDLFLGSLLK